MNHNKIQKLDYTNGRVFIFMESKKSFCKFYCTSCSMYGLPSAFKISDDYDLKFTGVVDLEGDYVIDRFSQDDTVKHINATLMEYYMTDITHEYSTEDLLKLKDISKLLEL